MPAMWCHGSLGRRSQTTCHKPNEEIPSAKDKGKSRRFRRGKSDGKGRGSSNFSIAEVYNDGSKTQTSHMKVPPGYAVLDCKLVAQVAQTCAREGERVGDERDTEAIDESYHVRGIGSQIVSSFMKLRVPGSMDGKEVSFAPSVTPGDIPPLVGNDHLIPWGCSICIQMSVVSKSHLVELMQSCLSLPRNIFLSTLQILRTWKSLIMMCGPRNEEETVKRQVPRVR